MPLGVGQTASARWRWAAAGCVAVLAAAWAGLGHRTVPNALRPHDIPALEAVQAAAAPGAAPYAQYCAVCHQTNGQGVPGTFPPLVGSPVVTGDPHYLARVVLYGLQGRIVVGGQTYSSAMAGLAKNMSDAQIAQVLTYIRSSWGNAAPAVIEDIVKAERAIPGTPQDNGTKYPK